MNKEINDVTETGVNVYNYVTDRDNGIVTISKGENGNFFHQTRVVTMGIVNNIPTLVEGQPRVLNFNAQSIADMRSALDANEAEITNIRAQLNALESDMNAL